MTYEGLSDFYGIIYENDELLSPEKEESYTFEGGEFKLYVKPLSWNVYVFEA